MTDALRAHGFRADASDVSFGPIGTGQMADSFRIQLTYAGSRESDPAPPRELTWIARPEDQAESLHPLLAGFSEQFIKHYGCRVSKEDPEVVRGFAAGSRDWLLGRFGSFGLVRGNSRLDNLLFATPAGGSPVAAVDWQTVMLGLL